jgi:hypothetical protein
MSGTLADDDRPEATAHPDLVKQANARVSSILRIRLQDSYAPRSWGLRRTRQHLLFFGVIPDYFGERPRDDSPRVLRS